MGYVTSDNFVFGLAMSADGTMIYSSSSGELQTINVTDPQNPELIRAIPSVRDSWRLAASHDNKYVVASDGSTGFTVIAADPNSARFAERTDTALKNYFKIASEADNFNLDLPTELSKLTKMVGNFSKTFVG